MAPHTHVFNRICLYCISLLKTAPKMAMLRPKHLSGTLYNNKWLFVVDCAIVGLNSVKEILNLDFSLTILQVARPWRYFNIRPTLTEVQWVPNTQVSFLKLLQCYGPANSTLWDSPTGREAISTRRDACIQVFLFVGVKDVYVRYPVFMSPCLGFGDATQGPAPSVCSSN